MLPMWGLHCSAGPCTLLKREWKGRGFGDCLSGVNQLGESHSAHRVGKMSFLPVTMWPPWGGDQVRGVCGPWAMQGPGEEAGPVPAGTKSLALCISENRLRRKRKKEKKKLPAVFMI